MVKRSLPPEKEADASVTPTSSLFPNSTSPEGSLRKIALHHVPMEWQPTSVVAIAASPEGCGFVAAARESGAIELYEVQDTSVGLKPFKVLPGSRDSSISCLCWVGEHRDNLRLFSGGFDGNVTEWSMCSLKKKFTQPSFGGAIWDISYVKRGKDQIIAIACDDGTIKFLRVENDGAPALQGKVVSDTGRVLSISWEKQGKRLVSGHSDGCVRIWDIEFPIGYSAGQEVLKISLPSYSKKASTRFLRKKSNTDSSTKEDGLEKNIPTVWCVLYLGDGTIASGDSGGRVCFWDSTYGTLLEKFDKHQADITTMVATTDNMGILASGADIRIASFQRISTDDGGFKWIYCHAKRPHSHDVRSMALYHSGSAEYLVTGSQDTHVMWLACKGKNAAQGFLEAGLKTVAMSPEPPILQIVTMPAGGPRLVISAQYKTIDFWQTWSDPENCWQDKEEHEPIDVLGRPRQIARVEIQESSNMTCCQLSQCGSYLASSSLKLLRLMRVEGIFCSDNGENTTNIWTGSQAKLSFKPLKSRHLHPALHVAFSPDSKYLCAAHADNTISLINMSTLSTEVTLRIESSQVPQHPLWHQIKGMMFNVSGDYLACTVYNRIFVFSFSDKKLKTSFAVDARVACACFDPCGQHLFVINVNKEAFVFDVGRHCLTDWSLQNPKLNKLAVMDGEIRGVQFRSDHGNSALVWSERSICHINFSVPIPTITGKKARHQKSDQPGVNMRIVTLQVPDNILLVGFTSMNSALLLRAHWSKIEMMLPPPVYRVRFGLS